MKDGSLFVLFCTYEMLQIAFLVSLESSQGGAGIGLVSWCLDLWEVLEY
jgi:hypothetical protein